MMPYALTPSTVARPGMATVTYANMNELTLDAGSGSRDTVSIVPSAATAFSLVGNHNQFLAGTGDVLDVDLSGVTNALLTTTGPGAGQWTFGNRQAVTFKNMVVNQADPIAVNDTYMDSAGNTLTVGAANGVLENDLGTGLRITPTR